MAADAAPPRSTDLNHRFAEEMGALLGPEFPKQIALAVSGGGDSMAMLYLAAPWARVMGISLEVLCVDHGLRDVGAEVALVRAASEELGLPFHLLSWAWDGSGNLSEAAREGRYAAMAAHGARHVILAHTQDDVAETFLMRLARGSGVDGLSAMGALVERGPLTLLRPLLATSRAELRHFLKVLKIEFAEDPTNDDPRFERVRMRRALPDLAALGLTAQRLADTAQSLARARDALAEAALEAHECAVVVDTGHMLFDVVYDRDIFAQLGRELQLRLLAAALQYVGGETHRPRLAALEDALDRALGGGASTLHGGYVYPHRNRLYICAEYERIAQSEGAPGTWRGWYATQGYDVRPLGEAGAAQLRSLTDLPARVLWPCPAVWEGDRVISCPRIGQTAPWNPTPDPSRFRRLITSR